MSKHNKYKDYYSTSGEEAPLEFDNPAEEKPTENTQVEASENKTEEIKEDNVSINDTTPTQEIQKQEKPKNIKKNIKVFKHSHMDMDTKTLTINGLPESITNTLIKVRIIGDRAKNGIHNMYPLAVANAVIENYNKTTTIITSKINANLIVKIINEYSDMLGKNLSSEMKKNIIDRFMINVNRSSKF